VVEFTRWLPTIPSTDIQVPGDQKFWLTNGVVGAEIRTDEVLFDVNIADTQVREEIEISVRGKKQAVMHSLYFFQYVIGRVMDNDDEDQPVNPHHVFRLRPASNLITPNGPGPLPGLPGGQPYG
jgi:hypothetical protein